MSKTYQITISKAIDVTLYSNYFLTETEIKEYLEICKKDNIKVSTDSLLEYIEESCISKDNIDIDNSELIEIRGLETFLKACKEYDDSRD